MAEVVELRSDESGEDEEEEIGPWFSSASDEEMDIFYRTRIPSGSGSAAGDSDVFVPVFSPHFRLISSDALDHEVPSDSEYESSYVDEQFTLAVDLPGRSSERLDDDDGVGGDGEGGGRRTDVISSSVNSLDFGVLDGVEDMGSDYLRLGLGLGFGMEKPKEELGGSEDAEADDLLFGRQWRGVWESGHGDDMPSSSREGEGLRIVGFETDSDSELEEEISSEMLDDLQLPSRWSGLHIEETGRGLNEDFEWEEVEERLHDSGDERSLAQPEERDDDQAIPRVEWEVLLSLSSLERSSPAEYDGFDEEHAELGYSSENEILFEQFAAQESVPKGSPPAATYVIEHLPSIVLTQSDVMNGNAVCAVCKDEISLEEKPKQLPCSHHYHADCILPWLRIRNTCPVCRHELPTDDPNYELQRAMGDEIGRTALHREVMYEFEIFESP